MSIQTFPMPDVGEGLTEAEVLTWHVAVGDEIAVNQVFVEIETAKAAVELPSPFAGRVHALLVEPGVTVAVGTPMISVDTAPVGSGAAPDIAGGFPAEGSGSEPGTKIGEVGADGRIATLVGFVSPGAGTTRRARKNTGPAAHAGAAVAVPAAVPAPVAVAVPVPVPVQASVASDAGSAGLRAPLATPPVRQRAKELGVDLRGVTASRADGVISRTDVETAGTALTGGRGGAEIAPAVGTVSASYDAATRERRVPIKGVRKATAQAMVASAFTAPHVTEFLTIDVTAMMELRDRLRRRPEFADVKLTPLTFVARAVCLAARRTPEINAVWDGERGEIVVKEYVHLGIAAATPRGLMVPNIRDADRLDLRGLAQALVELTATAREGRTSPTAMSGGTFTITNVGVFGVDTGTPIINPGESAILALGSIKDAPWVVDGQLAVRKVCQLALSFDHRVIDGQQGSQFLADVGLLLADPAMAIGF